MDKILALYDSDLAYATRFMEYFSKSEQMEFEVVVFTSTDHLIQYMSAHTIDIILLGEAINGVSLDQIAHVYYLFEDENHVVQEDCSIIIKYQSVKQIMKQVLSDISTQEHQTNKNSSTDVRVLTIYAPNPQLETLSFAWSLGAMHQEQTNSLFIPFDLFPISLISGINNSNPCLSDMIYFLKEQTNLSSKLPALIQDLEITGIRNPIHYLSGIYHCADLLSLTKEDIRVFVQLLKTATAYQTIIIYTNFLSEAMMELLSFSDKVAVLTFESNYDRELLKEWKSQMSRSKIEYNTDKFDIVSLNHEEEFAALPLGIYELSQSETWKSARHYLQLHEFGR